MLIDTFNKNMRYGFIGTDVSRASASDSSQAQSLESLAPTPEQLARINSFVPNGFPRLTMDDVRVVNIRVTDNLLNRGQSRWSIDSLKKVALMLPGKPALKNHDHYSIDSSWGKFFDAQFVQSDECDDVILDAAGNSADNRKIFDKEGYCTVLGQAFVKADHPILEDIAFSRVSHNSLGGFRYADALCPECDFSLMNPKCPHVLEGMYGSEDAPTVSHYIRHDLRDLTESSLVNCPNLPGSSVI